MTKLSPTQQEVLDRMKESGAPMIRLPGGFWTYQGCLTRLSQGYDVPEWHVSVQTIRAMEKKGLLVRSNLLVEEWKDPRVLPESK